MAASPTLRHRRLARAMTALREEAGLSITDAATAAGVNKGTISRLEAVGIKPSGDTVHALCTGAYNATEGTTNALVKLAREVKRGEVGWWQTYGPELVVRMGDLLELENDAVSEREFTVDLIPGLLQTEDYARAVIRSGFPSETDEYVQERVDVRMERQKKLADKQSHFWAIIDEIALERPTGGHAVMAGQLEHVVKAAAMPSVTVQLLPKGSSEHPALGVPFKLLDLDDIEYAFVENLSGGAAIDHVAEVKRYQEAWVRLTALALSFDRSAERISEVADRYRSGKI